MHKDVPMVLVSVMLVVVGEREYSQQTTYVNLETTKSEVNTLAQRMKAHTLAQSIANDSYDLTLLSLARDALAGVDIILAKTSQCRSQTTAS